jgi:beta-barrel assembly-enhancing protease
MGKWKTFLVLYSIGISHLFSQDFNNYVPLKSSGDLPYDFTVSSSKKYEQDKVLISKTDKLTDRKAKDKFYLESNFIIDDILLSGKVLYNDPLSIYANKVADKLLEGDKELRSKIRIYIVKSTSVNAFATNNGIIFINLGLIAQLEDEAQLAFILAHELTHYTKKHVITEYVEKENIRRGRGGYGGLSLEERYIARNNYSKELESEADLAGFDLFLKSGYNINSIDGVFDVLQFAYLPFDDVKFDKEFFETENLKFPNTYFLKETAAIKTDVNEDDSKSTHPSTSKRRAAIKEKVSNLINTNTNKSKFLVGEDEFIKARKISRYEMARLYLNNRRYEAAVYHTYLLLKKDPLSRYLRTCMAKALYGLSKYYNQSERSEIHRSFDEIEGNSQQVYHFFDKITKEELNVLAQRHLWKLKKEYPDDVEIGLMTNDIFKELVFVHFPNRSSFSEKPKEQIRLERLKDSTQFQNTDSLSKYEKIKKQQIIAEVEGDENFIKYGLVDLLKDSEFIKAYDQLSKEKEEKDSKKETPRERKDRITDEALERSEIKSKGYALGLEKVVFVNPYYKRIDERRKEQVRYRVSETNQNEFNNKILLNAKELQLDVQVVEPDHLEKADTEKFNENALLNEWIIEKLHHGDNINMTSPLHNEVNYLGAKYGTNKFCWMGAVSVTERKPNKAAILAVSIVYPFLLPYGILYAATPRDRTYFYTLVFDLNEEKLDMQTMRTIHQRDRSSVLNSNIYFSLLQMKYKRK